MNEIYVILEKSYAFAVRIVLLGMCLIEQNLEYVLSKKIIRSGTSVGTNVEEAIGGQSERDFYAKLAIAYKESRETRFWLRILKDTNYIGEQEALSLLKDVEELLRILGAITKTLKERLNS